jgi:cytochrome c oxidase subunit 2
VGVRRAAGDEITVDVVGHDWWWEVRYPGTSLQSANEIHLPVGRTAVVRLTSDDVVHSFWVPQIAGKLDVVPGQTNLLRVKPNRTGTFLGECAEFCGVQHANMRFLVVVEDASAFSRWTTLRQAAPSADTAVERGAADFQREACAGCHTIRGTPANGVICPDLSDFGRRKELGAGVAANTPENLLRWIRDPDTFKPGVIMPGFDHLSEGELHDLVAYLESLR